MNFDVNVPNAPFQGLFVRIEENIEPVSINGAAPVEDFYRPIVVVAWDNHFCAEGVFFVGSDKGICPVYFVAGRCYALRMFAATFPAGTISGYTHSHRLPVAGLFERRPEISVPTDGSA